MQYLLKIIFRNENLAMTPFDSNLKKNNLKPNKIAEFL